MEVSNYTAKKRTLLTHIGHCQGTYATIFLKGEFIKKRKCYNLLKSCHSKPDFLSSARCTRRHLRDVSRYFEECSQYNGIGLSRFPDLIWVLDLKKSSIAFCPCQVTGKIPEVAHFMYENPWNALLDRFPRLHGIKPRADPPYTQNTQAA